MNTLPVKKSSLILSKLITTIVAIAASTLVSAICLGIGIFGIYVQTADVIWALDILKDCDIVFFSLIFASRRRNNATTSNIFIHFNRSNA